MNKKLICSEFWVTGDYCSYDEIKEGNVNRTYKIKILTIAAHKRAIFFSLSISRKGLLSVNSRRQALKLCFDTTVVVVIQIVYQLLFEVLHWIEILEMELFALQQIEEVFYYSIIQTVALSAHTLNNTIIRQLFLVMFVLALPALVGTQNRCCPGQSSQGIIDYV